MKGGLITILVGAFIAVVSWVPLWIVTARDPQAIPFALGLITIAASIVGGVIAFAGLIQLVIYTLRAAKK